MIAWPLAPREQPAVDREGEAAGDEQRDGEAAPEERITQAGALTRDEFHDASPPPD
jgi:hypothetical protein